MAKVPFTKLGLTRDNSIKEIEWNGQKIEVKQYLPIKDKLDLISTIIALSDDNKTFYNPCRTIIVEAIEIIIAYTNINLTEKQGEDILKLYDLFVSSGFANVIQSAIPEEEINYIKNSVQAGINEIYRYRDSAMGIFEQIALDQKLTEDGVTEIINTLKNSEEIHNLQELSTKLG